MAEIVQFINNNDKAVYRSLYDTETKGRKTSERTVSDGNPSVVIRRNESRSNELEVIKTYELTDDDELMQRACGELNIMRRIHKQDADICAAKLYEWRLICADGRTLISTRDRPDDDAEEMLNAVDPLKAAEMEENNPFNRAQISIKKGYERFMKEVSRIEIVMEYGVPLMDFMNDQESIEAPDHKIRLLFKALSDLHNIGIVHEDIKPSNIILVEKAGNVVPVFIDFDVSALHNVYHIPFVPYNGSTAYYESPEQVGEVECDPDTVDENGKPQLTPKTDVYSMGVIAFDLLGTRLPEVRDERKQFVSKHKADSKTHEVLANALVKSPGTRYDAGGILNGLMEFCEEIPVEEVPREKEKKMNPLIWGIIVLFVCLCVGVCGCVYFLQKNDDSESTNGTIESSTSEITETQTFLLTTTTTFPSETTQPINTSTTATTTVQTEQPYTQPPPIDPQSPERTESHETITITPTEPTVSPTEPPTEPPTDPPIIEGVDENGFAYRIENGTATITGYQGTETEVIIPEYVAGVPVYAIGEKAFKSSRDSVAITRVVISNNVSVIGEGAFRGCTYLQEVILPISIKEIGAYAFFKNGSSDEITINYSGSSDDWNEIAKTEDLEKIIKTDEQDDEKYIILEYNDALKDEW